MAFAIELSLGFYTMGEDYRFFSRVPLAPRVFSYGPIVLLFVRLHCALDMDVVVLRG